MISLVGPTAVGKTPVSLNLANALRAEIVSADSMQVYRRMDIGTAKPTAAERAIAPIHLIDIIDPDQDWTLADFQRDGREACLAIERRGNVPLVVGGTGLYVRALTTQLDIPTVAPNEEFRAQWRQLAAERGNAYLQSELAMIDPEAAARIHVNDVNRLIRALEVHAALGVSISELHAANKASLAGQDAMLIALNYADRRTLYSKIDERVDQMVTEGLVDEVRGLLADGYARGLKAMKSLGYRHMAGYLEGECNLDVAVDRMKCDTRHFARRQLIWFRGDPRVNWVMVDDKSTDQVVEEILNLLSQSTSK